MSVYTISTIHSQPHAFGLLLLKGLRCAALLGCTLLSPKGQASPGQAWNLPSRSDKLRSFIEDHVEVGLELSYFKLQTTTKREFDETGRFTGGFLGSIDKLHAKQHKRPIPFLRLHVNRFSGIQLGYTFLNAKTSTYYGHSDGTFRLRGLTMEMFARHRFESGFAPYVAVGLAHLNAKFDHSELWHNGFSPNNPQPYRHWVSAGRPQWPNNGYQRTIALSDTMAWTLSGGCAYYLYPNWVANVGIRYMATDVDANYYLSWYGGSRRDQGTYKFPLDNLAFQLSVSYDF